MKKLGLYIHIPFCIKKCNYCDFPSQEGTLQEQKTYVTNLLRKLDTYREMAKDYQVDTIFIGGGTPSILEPGEIKRLMEKVYSIFSVEADAEISIEMNPGTATKEKVGEYKQAGINRLSIGLQSAKDEELKILGRIHTFEDFLRSYEMVRNEGFSNVNVDLMFGIPKQTSDSFVSTLKKTAALNPEHLSVYSLIIEEGTPFFQWYQQKEMVLPDEEEERQMYKGAQEILWNYGYNRYEISNYAKNGYECRHNFKYWNMDEYLGIGRSAASFLDKERFVENEKREVLTRESLMEEFMFLGLRKMEGIREMDFQKRFAQNVDEIYQNELLKLVDNKLLMREEGRIFLTERGIDISNYVMQHFIFDKE